MKNSQQEKTTHQAQAINKKLFILKAIVSSVATVSLIVAFFTHTRLPKVEPDVALVVNEKNELYDLVQKTTDSLISNTSFYLSNNVDFETYSRKSNGIIEYLNDLENRHEAKEAEVTALIKQKRDMYLGFPSRHKLLWNFTLSMIVCLAAIRLMLFSNNLKNTPLKYYEYAFSITIGTMGGYLIAWILWDGNDFSYDTYMALLVLMGLLCSVTAFFLTKFKVANRFALENLDNLKDKFLDFLLEVRNIHYKKLLVNALTRNEQYKRFYKKIMGQSLHEEAYDEMIKKDTETLETRLREEAREIDS